MKSLRTVTLVLSLILTLTTIVTADDIFSVKTALTASSARKSHGISVMSGETLEFSADDLELRLELEPQSLDGITITSLPRPEHGELFIDGIGLTPFEFIGRSEVDKLCFVPGEEAASAHMTFIPRAKNSVTTELTINILNTPLSPPEIQSCHYDTVKNVAVSGYIPASTPNEVSLQIQVVKQPHNGVVRFDGMAFTYTPYKDVYGEDSFTVCAVDAMGNFSKQANVGIGIEKRKTSFYYADMTGNPSAYAAIKLHENGVISGMQIGGKYFLSPDEMTTRGEFLIMLTAASGLGGSLVPTVNTGLPNDALIPSYLKPYVKKAVDEDIWSSKQAFNYNEIPTRAEAVVLTDRFAKITDVKDFALKMSDRAEIPKWALPSYKDLAAYRMLDLYDNAAHPANALTNSYSVDLAWQLWKHCHI